MSDPKNPDKKLDDNLIEGHNYDGILELDHPLPRWWVYLFCGTIVFGVMYFSYYEYLGGPSHEEQYYAAMAKIEKQVNRSELSEEHVVEKNIFDPEMLKDPTVLEEGRVTFKQYCAACHGQSGEGVIGPNLTDRYWIYSKGDYQGVMAAIRKGFPSKGMPPWGDIVPGEKQPKLAAFVLSLVGSKPKNPKAAQGKLVE